MHVCQLCICPNIHKPISAEIWSLLCVHGCIAMCAQFPNIACTHACVPMVYKCDVTGENLCNSLRYMCSCTCGENSLHNRMHSYTTTRAIALLYAVAHTCILRQYCHCIATIYCMVVWFVAGWHMSWKNIFQHVWLSQYWNCMAGCNVELLWNMWYKTDQRISQFPACWFVFLHCDTCHENTHSNIYDYHNIEHVWCDVIVKLKKQNMYTCNDTGTRIWEEHCIPVRHEKHDHCTRIRDEHCIPMRQEKHEHCTRIWRNIAFLNDKKTRALHSNLGGTLESIHKKLWLHRIQGGQALPPLLY